MKSAPLPCPQTETATEPVRIVDRYTDEDVFQKFIGLSRARAWEIVGGLSRPSKMPCYSWGIPAQSCITGSKLAQIEGTVCQQCYALKGHFRRNKVQAAYQRRLEHFGDPRWIEAMVKLVYWQCAETGVLYFRWFDSGDLQSVEMLRSICAVAACTPEIKHWLPTREHKIVEAYLKCETLPSNLTVRISAALIDGNAVPCLRLPTSTVHESAPPVASVACAARGSEPVNCGTCRACWDRGVENVSYPLH